MTNKIAVVLFNLGGPDSTAAVRPFLYNLFSDPDIFRFPLGFITQKLFASIISRRRAPEARQNYAAIGGKSPLLERTQEQAIALHLALEEITPKEEYSVYVCMRYWHPMTNQVVAELKEKNFEKVILLPLYPQYSTTTTGSSYNEFMRQCRRQRYLPATTLIRNWHTDSLYKRAVVKTIENEARHFTDPRPEAIELLFSAHGLPQKIVDAGDPYEKQISETFDSVREQLGWPHASLCYQSRVGPLKWLQPYTEEVIRQKAQQGAKQMLIYPIAFVSDHVETLFELKMQYGKLANELGISEYRVVPALNDHPLLIKALAKLVLDAADKLR